ncbi:outer membrane lipoprotein-sorting protein [Aurantivibrio plasticivorans]
MSQHVLIPLSLAAVSLVSTPCLATSDSTKDENLSRGLQIMKELEARDTGWEAAVVDMQMTLRNASGEESERQLTVKLLEVEGDGDKTLTQFKSPRDIRNTAFLSYSHAVVPDDQWIYMPAIKRVKRINSANKSGPFMGSELAYEDISSFELEKYSYRYIGEEPADGVDCYVVELTPLYEYTGYSTMTYWVDKSRFVPIKIEYYDRSKSLLKTQHFAGYRQYNNQFWRPAESQIHNHQTDRATFLQWSEFDFDVELSDAHFSTVGLTRSR